jgi:hypothetical protein
MLTTSSVPNACSYVLQSGFHQQHWYNCFTCNLIWDKGCCTLCALRCHEGHDVTYSRHSSFFCDCGGEPPGEGESRGPCKCVTPISSGEVKRILEGQKWPVIVTRREVCDCLNPLRRCCTCPCTKHIGSTRRTCMLGLFVSGDVTQSCLCSFQVSKRLENGHFLSRDCGGNDTGHKRQGS